MNAAQFKDIYYPHYQKLYRIAFRMLTDVQSAEDVVQETYLKLWSKAHELNQVETPEAYAVTMLRNLCLNHIRDRKDMIQYEYDIPEIGSMDVQIDSRDQALLMKQLIGKLPSQQQEVITLRHCEGYSYEDIVKITGLDIKHIRVIVSRARKTLCEQFNKTEAL